MQEGLGGAGKAWEGANTRPQTQAPYSVLVPDPHWNHRPGLVLGTPLRPLLNKLHEEEEEKPRLVQAAYTVIAELKVEYHKASPKPRQVCGTPSPHPLPGECDHPEPHVCTLSLHQFCCNVFYECADGVVRARGRLYLGIRN